MCAVCNGDVSGVIGINIYISIVIIVVHLLPVHGIALIDRTIVFGFDIQPVAGVLCYVITLQIAVF